MLKIMFFNFGRSGGALINNCPRTRFWAGLLSCAALGTTCWGGSCSSSLRAFTSATCNMIWKGSDSLGSYLGKIRIRAWQTNCITIKTLRVVNLPEKKPWTPVPATLHLPRPVLGNATRRDWKEMWETLGPWQVAHPPGRKIGANPIEFCCKVPSCWYQHPGYCAFFFWNGWQELQFHKPNLPSRQCADINLWVLFFPVEMHGENNIIVNQIFKVAFDHWADINPPGYDSLLKCIAKTSFKVATGLHPNLQESTIG